MHLLGSSVALYEDILENKGSMSYTYLSNYQYTILEIHTL